MLSFFRLFLPGLQLSREAMPKLQANLGLWTAPPKRLSQAGDWFYLGEIALGGGKYRNIRHLRHLKACKKSFFGAIFGA